WPGKCPLWVGNGHPEDKHQCPLYPRKRTLPAHVGMSALCQKRTFDAPLQIENALRAAALPWPHLRTSSTVGKNACGSVRPRAAAVLALMANSNLVGCSTGMSPGFVPRRILSTIRRPFGTDRGRQVHKTSDHP